MEKELGFCKTTTSVGSLNTLFLFFYSTLHHNQAKKPATINTNNLATIHDYVSILVAISSALWHNSLIPGKLLLPWALAIVWCTWRRRCITLWTSKWPYSNAPCLIPLLPMQYSNHTSRSVNAGWCYIQHSSVPSLHTCETKDERFGNEANNLSRDQISASYGF